MNKETRRRPRQSGSASSAGVPVTGLACEMPVDRRRFLIGMRTIATIGASALALASGWRSSLAQSYPTAPVKLIVTTGAGGAPDVIARIVAEGLSRQLGPAGVRHQSSGRGRLHRHEGRGLFAGGRLHAAVRAVVEFRRAAGDRQGLSLRPGARLRLDRFRLRAADGGRGAASLGINTLGELIDYVKKRPGQVNVAVLSRGGIPHLTSEWIKIAAGLEWTSINYPGTPAGLSDVMGGRVQAILDGLPSLAGAIRAVSSS